MKWSIFQNMESLSIMTMEEFHDYTMMILLMIMIFLFFILLSLLTSKYKNLFLFEGQILETFWTIFPMIILMFIAYPSLFYLYFFDMSINPSLSIKVFGVQWYWNYEHSDFKNLNISSYMMSDSDLVNEKSKLGWRLLECDSRLILPFNTEIRMMITSQDVIHSFSLPSIGLKVDAVPGRLNWTNTFVKRPGIYYGQCSEICGVGHAFMPISVEFVNKNDFFKFIKI